MWPLVSESSIIGGYPTRSRSVSANRDARRFLMPKQTNIIVKPVRARLIPGPTAILVPRVEPLKVQFRVQLNSSDGIQLVSTTSTTAAHKCIFELSNGPKTSQDSFFH